MHWFPLEFFYLLDFHAGLKLILHVLGSSFLSHFCSIRLTSFCRHVAVAAAAAATVVVVVVVVVVVIITVIVINFVQGICNYVPEKKSV